mgnify:CR=1 FL=1
MKTIDELIAHYGIQHVFIESGKLAMESKCKEIDIDISCAKHYWCELSWSNAQFDCAFNSFGDSIKESFNECLNRFKQRVRNNELAYIRAAKFYNIYEEIINEN